MSKIRLICGAGANHARPSPPPTEGGGASRGYQGPITGVKWPDHGRTAPIRAPSLGEGAQYDRERPYYVGVKEDSHRETVT